jgi:DNA-directed RNA polymerase specialized sigma24 family protein
VAARCARTLVERLPRDYADAVRAVDLDGEPPGDAAARLGISRNLLAQRAARGRRKLKAMLARVCGIVEPDDACACA